MRHALFLIFCGAMNFGLLCAAERAGFRVQEDVAQYKGSDYANVVHVARNITLEEAFDIAEKNPQIDYFVYTKGRQMVLEIPPDVQFDHSQDPFGLAYHTNFIYDSGEIGVGYCRIFKRGDVLFFKKEGMWLGSAPGLADAYFKE
jgi:hypothetical protein